MAIPAWQHRAACKDVDPDQFFPVGTVGPALEQIESAKRVCGTCLVREECLDWALATGHDSGIWGAMTEEERRVESRRRRGGQIAA